MCDIGANYIKTIKATTLFVVFLFVHSWEQRKLGDLFNYYRPDNYIVKSDKYVENAPTPVLTANKGFILGYTNENRSFSQPCIIFDDFTLDSKFVDFPFMVKSSAMKILVLKDEKIDDLIFCYELLNSTKIEVLGHARHYISVVQPTAINIPRYEEQRRISELFQQISNLITLHQRKDFSRFSQILRRKKHSFLPISWEQRKVSELFRVTRGYVLAATQTETTKTDEKPYPVYSSQTKDKGLMGYYKDYLYEDAITWTTDGANAGTVNYRAGKFYCTNVCGVLLSNEVKANQMIAEALNSVTKGYVSYVGNPKLMNNVMADIVIQIPTQAEEREQLSSFFSKLDNLITLHQRECFYIYKKYLLFLEMQNSHKRNYSWEQRKFNELYEKVSEKNDLTYGTDEIISVANMYFKSDSFITDKEYLRTYNVFHLGDIAFEGNKSKNFAHGRFVENTIGDGIVSHVFDVFRPKIKYDLLFWKYAINNERLMGGILVRSTKASTMMTNLVANDFLRETILVPSLEEQKKIGSILENVDNLITLHQCESCKKVAAVQSAFARRNLSKWADSWEQRKLGDLVKEVTRRDPNSNAPIMMITANNGFIEQSERYAFNNAGESLKKYILLQKGELAYNHGASKLRPYGSCFALTTAENARIPFVYHCFSAERMNHEFLSIELNGNGIESQLRSIVSSGARMDGLLNISFGEYTSVSILFPKKNEQDKIADFFRQLDNLITLHQCKVFYKNIIFNNIKFGGLETENNTSWEQRKLGDYFIERNERSGDGEMISVTINSGIRKFDELNRHDTKPDDLSKYKRVEIGDIAYNSMRMWQGASGYSPYSGILSPAYTVITPKEGVSSRFFSYLIKRPKTIHLFEINSQGLTKDTWNLKFPAFAPIEVKAPVSYEEQVNISRILIQLDNLITLHQRIKIFFTGDYHDKKNK